MRNFKRKFAMARSGIGIEKAIPIRVWSNRIVVNGEYEIPVDASVRTESLVERVLIAMDRVQSNWPSAGNGYYWVPTLKYEVVPGGDQVQQRLNSALFDLGLVSNVTYLDADPDKAKASGTEVRSQKSEDRGQAKPKSPVVPKKPQDSNDEQAAPPSREAPPSRDASRTRAVATGRPSSLAPSTRAIGKGVFGGALTVGGPR